MKGSGRRSAADKAAKQLGPIQPTRKLSDSEAKVWSRVVDNWPADHFVASDADLLVAYCAVCVAFDNAVPTGDINEMSKAARMMATLGTKLRLTPQSRVHQHVAASASRAGRRNQPANKPLLGGMKEEWQGRNGTQPH